MARSNSPGYPNLSLPKAISAVRKMFEADRRNPIDRITAAKHIGYGGQSGASDKALASLSHYGLTDKTGKGEVRVSRLALDLIHPDPTKPGAAASHLLEAGMKPVIFKTLYERFGSHVSEDALRSYLIRENFQNVAINPVINAYFETCRYLEQHEAFESGGSSGEHESEQAVEPPSELVPMMPNQTATPPLMAAPSTVTARAFANEDAQLNKINMNVKGHQVHLEALLNRKGIAALKKKLISLEALLDDDEDEDDGRIDDEDREQRD